MMSSIMSPASSHPPPARAVACIAARALPRPRPCTRTPRHSRARAPRELLLVEAREQHDRHRHALAADQGRRDVVAVRFRHLDVDEDQVRVTVRALQLERDQILGGRNREPRGLERGPRDREREGAVVEHQDRALVRVLRGRARQPGHDNQRAKQVAEHERLVDEQVGAGRHRRLARDAAARADRDDERAAQPRVGAQLGDQRRSSRRWRWWQEVVDEDDVVRMPSRACPSAGSSAVSAWDTDTSPKKLRGAELITSRVRPLSSTSSAR